MSEVKTGDIGVWLPSDEHDSRYTPGTLYAVVSIDAEPLEAEAAQEELVLDRKTLGGTGIHARQLPAAQILNLRNLFKLIHADQLPTQISGAEVGATLLRAAIHHFAREPFCLQQRRARNAHSRTVRWARSYIMEHLNEPISIDNIAAAAFASRRTLYRAFAEILDDTPQRYVRRLRLHRIRHRLASDAEQRCTIALVANQWGISELGRMSVDYRRLFGERPSETLAHAHGRTFTAQTPVDRK
jgi:AraC-like DNA-binding protein